jgi:hypothetical protein
MLDQREEGFGGAGGQGRGKQAPPCTRVFFVFKKMEAWVWGVKDGVDGMTRSE